MAIEKIIKIKNLFHNFGERILFENINLHIDSGKFIFLNGESGSGKTTFLKILHGEICPVSGLIEIAGISFGPQKRNFLHSLRRKVTMIHQDFMLLEDQTVEENIVLPLRVMGTNKKQRLKRLEIVLKSLELSHIRTNKCRILSGGEKQRVSIARAIIVNPMVLLADEPTGNLDLRQTLRLLKILKHFNSHGTTVIFATHNPELRKYVENSQLLVINDGKILEIK